jgi:pyroglutamyl-peptidase
MKVLLTAFDPFGGEKVNAALKAVKLVSSRIGTVDIVKLEVPTVFRKSIDKVVEAMKEEKPDVVLCVGQAGGRFDITPERVAINVDDARIKDNEGNQPVGTIYEDGENAYFATLPIKAMVQKIRDAGLPASVSNTAGTFVCNHLMYGVLYHIAKRFPSTQGGFIHVPFIPVQVVDHPSPSPSLSLNDIVKGLEEAIKAIAESTEQRSGEDLNSHEGKEF